MFSHAHPSSSRVVFSICVLKPPVTAVVVVVAVWDLVILFPTIRENINKKRTRPNIPKKVSKKAKEQPKR
jgi:hypothetical protein